MCAGCVKIGIGWHLDGGAAHYLARLNHNIGTFLALTGSILKAQDVMYSSYIVTLQPIN
jgi:enoyl-CoA hydratase/carnithine racemase